MRCGHSFICAEGIATICKRPEAPLGMPSRRVMVSAMHTVVSSGCGHFVLMVGVLKGEG